MFVYCLNNPVIYYDPCGFIALVDDITIGVTLLIYVGVVALVMSPPMQKTTYNGIRQFVEVFDQLTEQKTNILYAKKKSKSLPPKGDPNSDAKLENDDGSTKQRRHYDSDCNAEFDIDYNHSDDGTHEFPHVHIWRNGARISPELDFWQFFNMLIEFI